MDPIAIVIGSGVGAVVLCDAMLIRLPCPELAPRRTVGSSIAHVVPLALVALSGRATLGHSPRLSLASADHTVSH